MKKIIDAIDRVNYNISFNSGKYLDALNEMKEALAALNAKVDAIAAALEGSSNRPSGVAGAVLVAALKGQQEEPSTDEILTELRKAKDVAEMDPRFIWSSYRSATINDGYATIQYIAKHFGVKGWNLTNALRYAHIKPAYKKGRANYYPVNSQALRTMYKALQDYKEFVLSEL